MSRRGKENWFLRNLAFGGLFLSFLLAPFHPLSHEALTASADRNDIAIGLNGSDSNPPPSHQTCPICQSLHQQRHASSAPVGLGLELLSWYGSVEDAALDPKSVEPLGWQLSRAPPRWI